MIFESTIVADPFLLHFGEYQVTLPNAEALGLEECNQAQILAQQCESSYSQLAELLLKIKEGTLWRAVKASSFKQFVTEHLKISDSLSRQLLKVSTLARDHGISKEKMESLAWSKLAEVAAMITPENKDQVLQDIANLSQKELRAKFGSAMAAKKEKKARQKIVISDEIMAAVLHAARFTHQDDFQVNLDFVASQFRILQPTASEPRFSLN